MLSEQFVAFAELGAEWVLWLLIGLSVLSIGIMIDRALWFRTRDTDTGEIALAITPGGFGTTAGPELRLDGLDLVAGHARVPATGRLGDLADSLGVVFGAPEIYPDGSGVRRDDIVDRRPDNRDGEESELLVVRP